MAEPWSRDLAALAEHSRHGLRPLGSFSHAPEETKMRFFKTHPALAALFTVLALGLVSGAAYAVVREVWVSIDPDKPAPEIQKDITSQLEQQGVHADIEVAKPEQGRLELKIKATREGSGEDELKNLHVMIGGVEHVPGPGDMRRVELEIHCQLTPEQREQVQHVIAQLEVDEATTPATEHPSDADTEAAITKALAALGFHDVVVHANGGSISVVIESPPTAK